MKILIIDFDFFQTAGGGQTYYSKLIERNPAHDFYFFTTSGAWQAPPYSCPQNAHPIPFYSCQIHSRRMGNFQFYMDQFFALQAYSIAYSIKGQSFDIVDVPSFRPLCQYLRPAFEKFNVTFGRIAFGLHGWVSLSIKHDWGVPQPEHFSNYQSLEHASLESADIRYGISLSHIQDTPIGLPIHYVDTHNLLEPISPTENYPTHGPIDLWFVGRIEKLKGIEQFLTLASQIPQDQLGKIYVLGPDGTSSSDIKWSEHIAHFAKKLNLEFTYLGEKCRADIPDLVYNQRSLVCITSLYDSLNLVAIEALFRGCPTLISQRAGIHDFLQKNHPTIPFISFNPDMPHGCLQEVKKVLAHYDSYRSRLIEQLNVTSIPSFKNNFISEIYNQNSISLNSTIESFHQRFCEALPDIYKFIPLVSIITPTYNRAQYIEETLQSILNQTYPFIEYIIINDGSYDQTRAILDRYLSHIKLITQENRGEGYSANAGLKLASGELIAIINDDDPVDRSLVEEMVNIFAGRDDIGVCYPDWKILDKNGQTITEIKTHEYNYRNMLSWFCCMPGPGTFFRRRIIDSAHKRNTQFRYMTDYEFWLQVGLHENFYRLPKTLSTWRDHEGAATVSTKGPVLAKEAIRLMKSYYSQKDLPTDIRKIKRYAFANTYFHACMECWGSHKKLAYWYLLIAQLYYPLLALRLPPNHQASAYLIAQDLQQRNLLTRYLYLFLKTLRRISKKMRPFIYKLSVFE